MVNIRIINKSGFGLPRYESTGAAAFDIKAKVDAPVDIAPGDTVKIHTGLYVEVPKCCELQIRSRSGLAAKHGVIVTNSPGTIDSDYRGEVLVLLTNFGRVPYRIKSGDRVAQGVMAPIFQARWIEAETLSETERGSGGFGSTGI